MVPKSTLINVPNVDFGTLIKACEQALGRSVSEGVDNTSKKLSDAERFISILAAIKNADSPVGLPPNLLPNASFSVMTIAEDLDLLDMLEACAGMSFVQTESITRAIVLAVISGTLQQWRDAIVTGSREYQQVKVRLGFNEIHNLFVGTGLGSIWNDYEQQPLKDGYALIEYRP